jgi:hypothetical protein
MLVRVLVTEVYVQLSRPEGLLSRLDPSGAGRRPTDRSRLVLLYRSVPHLLGATDIR